MFFDEIKLSKQSWHYKLQNFTFGSKTPDLWSFCPYFWLTIFCMLVSPITLIIRAFHSLIMWPLNAIADSMEASFDRWVESLDEKDYYGLYWGNEDDPNLKAPKIFGKSLSYRQNIAWDRICKRKGITYGSDEFYDYVRELKLKYEERSEELWKLKEAKDNERYRRKENFDARKEKFLNFILGWIPATIGGISDGWKWLVNYTTNVTKIVIWTQRLFTAVLTVVIGLSLAVGMDYFGQWVMTWNWQVAKPILQVTGLSIAGLLILIPTFAFIADGIRTFANWVEESHDSGSFMYKFVGWCKSFGNGVAFIFTSLWTFIKWIGRMLFSPFMFFWIYFKATKNDHCPAILWDDEESEVTPDEVPEEDTDTKSER